MTAWIITMWLALPALAVALYYTTEAVFYCFCRVFCIVDTTLQGRNRQGRITVEDLEELQRMFNEAA